MREYDVEPSPAGRSHGRKQAPERQAAGPRPESLARLRSQGGARAHSALVNRSGPGAALSLLSLQRQYGNRYVQRVLALASKVDGETEAAPEVDEAIQRARGRGQALDSGVRVQMESAFGADFRGVRVHAGAEADTLNRSLSARAFTTGTDIFFRQGEYDASSSRGRELLAHELTHVVQQKGGAVQGKLTIGQPGDEYEQEADRMAAAVIRMEGPGTSESSLAAGQVQTTHLQRVCAECEEELRRQPEEEEEEPIQTGMTPGMSGTHLVVGRSAGPSLHVIGIGRTVIQRQPTIRHGSIGCPVPEAQEKLNVTGAALVVDGRFGPLTAAAVRDFQRTHPPLIVDGVVGPATWPELHTAAPGDHGLPTGEDTHSNGWAAGTNATLHRWRQRLTPHGTSFHRCRVTEADPGGGSDTCWFPGSAFAPFTAVTGGTWDVDATNRWGDDFVGWFTTAVTYYRAQGRAPCGCSFPQSMRVVRPTGDVEYKRHQLSGTIGVTTVSSTRDGNTETRTWP